MKTYNGVYKSLALSLIRILWLSIMLLGLVVAAFAEEPAAKSDYKVTSRHYTEDGRLIINYTRTPVSVQPSTPVGPDEIIVTAACTRNAAGEWVSTLPAKKAQ